MHFQQNTFLKTYIDQKTKNMHFSPFLSALMHKLCNYIEKIHQDIITITFRLAIYNQSFGAC